MSTRMDPYVLLYLLLLIYPDPEKSPFEILIDKSQHLSEQKCSLAHACTHSAPPSPHSIMGIMGPGLVLAVIQQRARHIQPLPRSRPHPLTAHRNAIISLRTTLYLPTASRFGAGTILQ